MTQTRRDPFRAKKNVNFLDLPMPLKSVPPLGPFMDTLLRISWKERGEIPCNFKNKSLISEFRQKSERKNSNGLLDESNRIQNYSRSLRVTGFN